MTTLFKQTLLVSAIALTSTITHAKNATQFPEYEAAERSRNFMQNNCFYYADPVHQQGDGSTYTSVPYFASNTANGDTVSATGHFPAKLNAAKALVNFVAAATNNNFNLSWNTLSENTNDHFDVERSLDGSNFEKVGEAKGMDVASGKIFSFFDKTQAALVRNNDFYYRLKEVDGDGTAAYSKVLVARMFNSKNVYAMSVTPDATINDILVNVQLKKSAYVSMKIRDGKGNEILTKSENAQYGINNFMLSQSGNLPAGMYSLEIIVNSNERMTMKLIKD